MNAFDSARTIEAKGMAVLIRFLEERAERFVLVEKGPMARHLQEIAGDAMMNIIPPPGHPDAGANRFYSVEIKIEMRPTGNLFLETFSNKNLDDRYRHAAHGTNVGWMHKLRCDLLWYYFLESDELYVFDFYKLKRWFFGGRGEAGAVNRFREVCQSKYSQLNDTHGRIVPLADLHREVGYTKLHPKQIELFEAA